jgi:hypothetical protein
VVSDVAVGVVALVLAGGSYWFAGRAGERPAGGALASAQ